MIDTSLWIDPSQFSLFSSWSWFREGEEEEEEASWMTDLWSSCGSRGYWAGEFFLIEILGVSMSKEREREGNK